MAETSLIVGGTAGIGTEVARALALRDGDVVIAGRDSEKAASVAATIGANVRGIAVDISKPTEIAAGLADVGDVRNLVITAVDRDANHVKDYDIARASKGKEPFDIDLTPAGDEF